MPFSAIPLTLRQLILLLAAGSALISMLNVFYASYLTQREVLINHALESNRVYAAKLADSTNNFLKSIQQRLAYSALSMTDRFDSEGFLLEETERLRLQSEAFNSVVIVGADGVLRAASPESMQLRGMRVTSEGAQQALKEQKPLISKPYLSIANNLVVFISHPVVSRDGQYLGYVGGAFHLQKQNALYSLLGEHHYRDGSYLYVVDSEGRVIYHPDEKKIGSHLKNHPAVEAVIHNKAGMMSVPKGSEPEMLAGYAPVPLSGWGIIAQRPATASLFELDSLMQHTLLKSIPVMLIGLIVLYYLARFISLPLSQLARRAQSMDAKDAPEKIQQVRSWYFEATQLKSALLMGLAQLNQKIGNLALDAMTDPLTGLQNRRGLTATLDTWQEEHKLFSVIALDIDHFKRINDTHGHDAGDHVIKHLAQVMRESSRGNDVLCRSGGEEFVMLLPRVDLEIAKRVAERLRVRMELTDIPDLDINVTLSFGVACWVPTGEYSADEVLKMADQALYIAKQEGRNRVAAIQ